MYSEEYKSLLQQNHAEKDPAKAWGRSGARNFGDRVIEFLKKRPQVLTVLDFGAGQRTLEKRVLAEFPELRWTSYDPGIPEISEKPSGQFDLVLSSDVLEHIEPQHLESVLRWLHDRTKFYQYHLISCDPCKSTLPDGRNAHLIVEEPKWWYKKFERYGSIMYFADELIRKRTELRTYACIQIDKVP